MAGGLPQTRSALRPVDTPQSVASGAFDTCLTSSPSGQLFLLVTLVSTYWVPSSG